MPEPTRLETAIEQYPDASSYVDGEIAPDLHFDPVAPLMEIARLGPIVKRDSDGTFNGVRFPNNLILPDGERDLYFAFSYDAVQEILQNNRTFSSEKAFEQSLIQGAGKTLTSMDDPEHRYYKKLALPSFAHRIVNEELEKIARPIVAGLLDGIAPQGEAELMRSFMLKYPFAVIATLFGVPLSIEKECAELNGNLVAPGVDMALAMASKDKLYEMYQIVIDDHRKNGGDDMTSTLLKTEVDGAKLTDEEIKMLIFQAINAGLDTTARQTGTLLLQLLNNPDQLALLQDNPDLLEPAIWESLRTCPAAFGSVRVALEDTEVCGVKLPKGAGIYVHFMTANRDNSRWSNPDAFDITRDYQRSLSFGYGIHSCIGQHLAMVEMKIAMQELLARLPKLRKDERRWHKAKLAGFQMRSPTQLPVCWSIA